MRKARMLIAGWLDRAQRIVSPADDKIRKMAMLTNATGAEVGAGQGDDLKLYTAAAVTSYRWDGSAWVLVGKEVTA